MSVFKQLFRSIGSGAGAFILAIASVASYLLGWLRDAIFARLFEATAFTDSYFKAFLLPDIVLMIFITGALLGLVIPLYVQAKKISAKEGARVFGTFFFVLNSFYALAAAVCFIFLDPILQIMFPDTPVDQQIVLLNITKILLLSNFFFALSNFIGHFLLAQKRFLAYSFAPLLYNVGIIAGILLMTNKFGIYAAAWGALLGAFLHFVFRFLDFCFCEEKFSWEIDWKNPFLWSLFTGMIPKVVSLLSLQVGFYFFARMGDATLGAGNYSAFQYARNLQSFAVSLFGISIATAIFPFLAEFIAEKKVHHFMFRLEKSLRQILFLALPAAAGMMLIAPEIVQVIYGAQEKGRLIVAVLIPLALAIPFECVHHLLVRSFHVLKNTTLPMIGSLIFISFVIGISGFLILKLQWGIISFGIAYCLGFIAQLGFLFFWLPKLSIHFPWKEFLPKFGKTVLLTVVMGMTVGIVLFWQREFPYIVRFLSAITAGGGMFFGGAILLQSPEIIELPLWKWWSTRIRNNNS